MSLRVTFAIAIILSACSNNYDAQQPSETMTNEEVIVEEEISSIASEYLDELINIMSNNALHRNTIDWDNFREEVFSEAGAAQTISETHNAIRKALILLGDNHSFFITVEESYIFSNGIPCNGDYESVSGLPDTIGYVKVNGNFLSDQTNIQLANEIQDQIIEQDNPNIEGWIVDLRDSGGGNMWPMLAGIGPILGEGTAGYFSYPDGTFLEWSFEDGAAKFNNSIALQLYNSYHLITPNPKVALLIDNGVASSGEAIVVSFLGRPNTKTFGASSTCGLSTGNTSFSMSDGAFLYLTTSNMADRNQQIYGQAIAPEQLSSNATIIQDAIEWLDN
ncbi:S41 family peptidase [Winogradskyella sp.]|uniref:S41 family peptidase n=1 Tax=Winogradskyella sp. TaxID=1883156 RepID=UPI00260B9953|nr:S41 family peptidase [Winogradskyella sp.]